jgi:NarL family two-component system response regulator YdfI
MVTPLPFAYRSPTPTATARARRVLLLQADPAFARELRLELEAASLGVTEASTRSQALDALELVAPDAVLLDLVPREGDGVELIAELAKRRPSLAIVVVSPEQEDARILSAIRAGASGYVFRADLGPRVVPVIEEALRGGAPLSRPVARLLLQACRGRSWAKGSSAQLTRRENTVLGMLAEGKSYAEVGLRLGVSENTVRSHVRSIYDKLGVRSKTEAVIAALRLGIVRLP